MSYGRYKHLVSTPVSEPSHLRHLLADTEESREVLADRRQLELERLRSINTHLLREIEALRAREAEAQSLADRDGLTGLYNRRRMQEVLDQVIADAKASNSFVGLLFIDLNGFKGVNDEYGHVAGDKVLTIAATRISARVRVGDYVCRYGGDEFVVILPNVPDPGAVARVADSIRERVSLPYWINDHEQHLTAAIGESMFPFHGDSADALIQRADQAMYRVKTRQSRAAVSLGRAPESRPSRRSGDKAKTRTGGAL